MLPPLPSQSPGRRPQARPRRPPPTRATKPRRRGAMKGAAQPAWACATRRRCAAAGAAHSLPAANLATPLEGVSGMKIAINPCIKQLIPELFGRATRRLAVVPLVDEFGPAAPPKLRSLLLVAELAFHVFININHHADKNRRIYKYKLSNQPGTQDRPPIVSLRNADYAHLVKVRFSSLLLPSQSPPHPAAPLQRLHSLHGTLRPYTEP